MTTTVSLMTTSEFLSAEIQQSVVSVECQLQRRTTIKLSNIQACQQSQKHLHAENVFSSNDIALAYTYYDHYTSVGPYLQTNFVCHAWNFQAYRKRKQCLAAGYKNHQLLQTQENHRHTSEYSHLTKTQEIRTPATPLSYAVNEIWEKLNQSSAINQIFPWHSSLSE